VLYSEWEHVKAQAQNTIAEADAAIITSYCPDAIDAADRLVLSSRALKIFYDLDTPVTLAAIANGVSVPYIGPRLLKDFDLVLSYTGGSALTHLQDELGAKRVAPLYGHVDPGLHCPTSPQAQYKSDLSYLGTYSTDRQAALEALLLQPARHHAERRFLIAGAQYPQDFPWSDNIYFVRHLPPAQHSAFFCSSRLTLNLTRTAMARMGWCPSGRLFEATACGTPVLSDWWEGLDTFFTAGCEILVAGSSADAIAALEVSDTELNRIARAARERTLQQHSSDHRAGELIAALEAVRSPGHTAELAEA
jgi:spore maturation protein CgeB